MTYGVSADPAVRAPAHGVDAAGAAAAHARAGAPDAPQAPAAPAQAHALRPQRSARLRPACRLLVAPLTPIKYILCSTVF